MKFIFIFGVVLIVFAFGLLFLWKDERKSISCCFWSFLLCGVLLVIDAAFIGQITEYYPSSLYNTTDFIVENQLNVIQKENRLLDGIGHLEKAFDDKWVLYVR